MHAREHGGFGGRFDGAERAGRLVLVVEKNLSEPSRLALRELLAGLLHEPDVTMVAGIGRASVMAAAKEGDRIFYNRAEYMTPDMALQFMPWRCIWLVGGGRVWELR